MLDLEAIKKILPHRDPFLLIDRVTELRVAEYAKGEKQITKDEFYFKGHFPEQPVMPGVLILETMAQIGAVSILSDERFKGKIAFFTGVKEAKFRKSVLPGDLLVVECQMTRIRANFGFGEAKAYVGDTLVCEATISFAIGN